jgi:hypothetical protein
MLGQGSKGPDPGKCALTYLTIGNGRADGVFDRFEMKRGKFQKWKLELAIPKEAGTRVYFASSMTSIALTSA